MRWIPLVFLFFTEVAIAQFQIRQWFFGQQGGMNFNSGTSYPLNYFPVSSSFGSTTMSDCSGNLLFYSNGEEVRNSQHQVLPNSNLRGDQVSPVVSIPYPGHPNEYYLVYISDTANSGRLYYSIVDMNVPGGAVITKDIHLLSNNCHMLGAVQHENKSDYWFVTHIYNSDVFLAFKITSSGLMLTPVVTHVGPVLNNPSDKYGAFEFSSDGKQLVNVVESGKMLIYDFDRNTGVLTLSKDLSYLPINQPKYAALSRSKNILYINSVINQTIFQVNLAAGSSQDIINSMIRMDSLTSGFLGEMQMGPDGKLYIAYSVSTYLTVINEPDVLFPACNYQLNGKFLSGNSSYSGLPLFVQTFFNTYTKIKGNNMVCTDSIIQMQLLPDADTAIVTWSADPGVQILSSTEKTCTLTSSVPGIYIVNAIIQYPCGTDTLKDTLFISEVPLVVLGSDTSLCEGQTLSVTLVNNNYNFLWSDGDISPVKNLQSGETYVVTVSNQGCTATDEITIDELPQNMVLSKSGTLCDLYNQFPECSVTNAITVNWFPDNIIQSTFSPQQEGFYWFIAEDDSGCTYKDTLFIKDECPVSVYIPSAFTPNNDGINDFLNAFISRPEITEGTLKIFNRYGQNIYSADLINANWNGTYNNRNCPEGIYIYKATWKDEEGITIEMTGSVLLMR